MLKMLAIDLGASSGRGIVGSFDGNKLYLRENHRFPNEPVLINGSFRWDIMRIFHEIKLALGKCAVSDDRDIASVGIDTWGVDVGFLDKSGQLMQNPYNYRDTRTQGILEKAFKIVPADEIYKTTGNQFMNFNTLFQLLATKLSADPWILERADKMLFTPDLLNYFLTGIAKSEYTIASTSQMLNARERNWDFDLLKRFDMPTHLLQDIVMPGTVLGDLLPAEGLLHRGDAQELGLGDLLLAVARGLQQLGHLQLVAGHDYGRDLVQARHFRGSPTSLARDDLVVLAQISDLAQDNGLDHAMLADGVRQYL